MKRCYGCMQPIENEKLHIRAEKTKCYSSFGMIEFIEKALNSNQ